MAAGRSSSKPKITHLGLGFAGDLSHKGARKEIEEHLGRRVHLFLHVKVDPKWDEDREIYEEVGLDWSA